MGHLWGTARLGGGLRARLISPSTGGARGAPLAVPSGGPAISGLRYLQTLWRGAGKVSAHPSGPLCAARTPGVSFPSRPGIRPAPFSAAGPRSTACRSPVEAVPSTQLCPSPARFPSRGPMPAPPACRVVVPAAAGLVCPGPSKAHRGSTRAAVLGGVRSRARTSCTPSCVEAPAHSR